MKFVSALLLSTLLVSCSGKVIPLKNNYDKLPFKYETTKSKDEVWDDIIDFFAQTGISIKIIDRSSGLIISDGKSGLLTTYETKEGKLKDPEAWVVAPYLYDPGPRKYFYPKQATGEWNIRIKEADGKTVVNINLLNIEVSYNYPISDASSPQIRALTKSGKSLHNFEKTIAEIISR